MNKKILTAVIGVVVVAVLGGLVYYFQGGNLQGFMKFQKGVSVTSPIKTDTIKKELPAGTGKIIKESSGSNVGIVIGVNNYPINGNELLPNAYVGMYGVIPVRDGIYQGFLLKTLSTGNSGNDAKFTVPVGAIVNFRTFHTQSNAIQNPTWTFYSPPYKNFTAQDHVTGRLCQINYIDDTTKMQSNGADSCAESMSFPAFDYNIVIGVNNYPINDNELLPNAYVNMYGVVPVRSGIYQGVLLETKSTGSSGREAIFNVSPGAIVDFVGFKTQESAVQNSTWVFGSPSYKNFTREDDTAGRLCQINYLDTTTKLRSNGSDSCTTSMGYPATTINN